MHSDADVQPPTLLFTERIEGDINERWDAHEPHRTTDVNQHEPVDLLPSGDLSRPLE
jgi:hypothetical protein